MVYAVIVTYNPDKELLHAQYTSLSTQVTKIVYVNNGSRCDEIPQTQKSVILNNSSNVGLGKAQNQGINIALQENADFVILFDQDSIPPDNFVYRLMEIYEETKSHISVGLIAPAIINAYKHTNTIEQGILIKRGRLKRIPLDRITEVSYCIASGSLIPTYVFENVGMIQEDLFIDGMDLEWCLRAKHFGFSIIQTNSTTLLHRLGNGSDNRITSHSPNREYYIIRNSIWISRQNYIPLGYRLRKKITPIIRLVISISKRQWKYTRQQLKGLTDGYKS